MNFYIADCHFGHKNVIRFDNRPFADLEQMEEVMVMLWNAAVRPGDLQRRVHASMDELYAPDAG